MSCVDRRSAFLLAPGLILLSLSACQTTKPPAQRPEVSVMMEEDPAWRKVATTDDAGRIERLSGAWSEALADARKSFSRQLGAEGDLLKPNAGLPRASPPPGSYRCRVIKLGTLKAGSRAFTAHKPFFCHIGVSQDQLSITKQTGTQRPGGYLWDTESTSRMIFLGSMALGNEDTPLPYGQSPARDMAGVFERYGDYRYRLLVPWPRQDSKLDVFELIPLVPQPE
jgi:hypothetical protein